MPSPPCTSACMWGRHQIEVGMLIFTLNQSTQLHSKINIGKGNFQLFNHFFKFIERKRHFLKCYGPSEKDWDIRICQDTKWTRDHKIERTYAKWSTDEFTDMTFIVAIVLNTIPNFISLLHIYYIISEDSLNKHSNNLGTSQVRPSGIGTKKPPPLHLKKNTGCVQPK